MKLSVELAKWRCDRPDEWKMDEFIRNAEKLEAEHDALAAQVEAARSLYVRLTNNAAATDSGGVCYVADGNMMADFNAWYDSVPQHHLREVKAVAGRAGFIAGFEKAMAGLITE